MNQQIHRHGEAVLKPISELPKGAKLVKEGKEQIVAHSESGHHHVLTAQNIRVYELDNETYLDVQGMGTLEHQKQSVDKHKTQKIAEGLYKIQIKKEFNYFKKAMQKVQD